MKKIYEYLKIKLSQMKPTRSVGSILVIVWAIYITALTPPVTYLLERMHIIKTADAAVTIRNYGTTRDSCSWQTGYTGSTNWAASSDQFTKNFAVDWWGNMTWNYNYVYHYIAQQTNTCPSDELMAGARLNSNNGYPSAINIEVYCCRMRNY